jgi:hypothetical protein
MNMSCNHEKCEPYRSCQALTERERRDEFWHRRRLGMPTDEMGIDPLAWLEGDTETG